MSRIIALAAVAVLLFLSFSGLTTFGMVGPDEPRYASIGQQMARSGDWVTPRLWGAPWFEKPALLYWMIGAAFQAGGSEDVAPRLPVACVSVAFLLFFFNWLRTEFNLFVGGTAAALLATSAMWTGYSHVAVTDIPLAACYCAALLLLVPLVEGRPAPVSVAAALLGLSVLAKGLVPLVLFLPFFWYARKYWRLWLKPLPFLVFAAVTVPWYAACTIRNGPGFLQVFFLQHQFGRFTSPELQHVQPFWFYAPWMIAAIFPSVLLLGFAATQRIYVDDRRRLLLALIGFGFVFFSISRNKLPGYILPLLPFVCILTACGLDAARRLWPKPLAMTTAVSMFLLPLFMLAAGVLPRALAGSGARGLFPVDMTTAGRVADVIPIAIVAAIASFFMTRERALILWFALVSCGWIYVEYAALPWLDRMGSARVVWRALPEPKTRYCVQNVSRTWRYELNYYSQVPLPECAPGVEHGFIGMRKTGELAFFP